MKNWRKNLLFIVLVCTVLVIFSGSASATNLNTKALSNYSNIYVNVSNDEGISFNTTGNGTYYIQSLSSPNGGFNAVHIANDSSYTLNYGGSTNTTNQSGIFYITDTGGRGYQDDGVLLLAVNGTIPDNFVLHLTASGYYWTPTGAMNAAPTLSAINYGITLDETFTKSDFLYGPQNWKPTGGNANYPICIGQNMSNSSNMFYLMFIDLHAGILGSNYPGGDSQFINNGAIKINYSFENLQSFAAFNIYAWNWNTTQGQGMLWTNSILPGNTGGPSGYTVTGTPKPSAAFTVSPHPIVGQPVQFTDKSTGIGTFKYAWDFNNDGIVDSTAQNPIYTYKTSDNYTVTLTVTSTGGSSKITQIITVKDLDVSASVPTGLYNSSLTVNLTATDTRDSNPKIYYTLNGSDPTTSSTLYTGPLSINNEGKTILKYLAVDKYGYSSSASNEYTIDKTAPTVTVNPAGGTYNIAQNATLTPVNNGNTTTYYTTDGSDPRSSNTRTVYSKPIQINANTTLKYAAIDAAGNWSVVYTQKYNMVDITAPIASANLPSGNYTTNQNVDLSAVDEMDPDPQIYYTLNGTNPTVNSTLYYLSIPINIVGTTVLKFIAVDSAGHISDIVTRVYILDKAAVSGTWNSTLVDTNNIEYNSIAIDSAGYPHIAYYQNAISGGSPQLKYAYKDKNGWHIETVESSGSGSGAYVSLVLDSAGNPHLAYEDIFGGAVPYMLKYAYKDSTGWHISTLTTNYAGNTRGDQIEGINLVLFNDQPRISFYNDTGGKIEYMYKNGTNWVTETVAANGGPYDSLAIDSSGNPRISYYSISQSGYGSLRYAQRTADGTWQMNIVDNSAYYVGKWNSLALDSFGNPYISYIWNSTSLKYAYWNGTQWITKTVSALKSSASKLVLDQSNSPLIIYQDAISKNLEYAYMEGSKWIISNIDSVNGAFGQISLALNSSGVPNVSYESTDYNLRYAYLIPFNVSASLDGGTYNTIKTVNLTSTAGTTIYYTKDGSDPRTSSTRVKYTGSISINSTTTLKFAAVDSASNWSSIHTETYIILVTVKIIDPANKAANIAISKVIKVTFSESIKAGTNYIELKDSKGNSIPFTTSISGNILTITPITGLVNATTYELILHTGCVTDLAGNKLALYSSSFTTDRTAPTVKTIDPANKSANIATNKVIKVTFSESIKAGTNYIEFKDSSGKAVSFKTSISGSVLTITPINGLVNATTYSLILHTGCVTDLAGNKLALYSSSFTTDRTAPTVKIIDPANKSTNIAVNKVIKVTFSEPIKVGSNYIELKDSKGRIVSFKTSISSNVLTITPTTNLTKGIKYTLILHTGCVTDLSGNKLALCTSTFTTKST